MSVWLTGSELRSETARRAEGVYEAIRSNSEWLDFAILFPNGYYDH